MHALLGPATTQLWRTRAVSSSVVMSTSPVSTLWARSQPRSTASSSVPWSQ